MNQDDKINNFDTGVEFEEYKMHHSYRNEHSDNSKIIQLMIKHSGGLIKNRKQANLVLFGIVVVAIVISFLLLFVAGKPVYEKSIMGQIDFPVDNK